MHNDIYIISFSHEKEGDPAIYDNTDCENVMPSETSQPKTNIV